MIDWDCVSVQQGEVVLCAEGVASRLFVCVWRRAVQTAALVCRAGVSAEAEQRKGRRWRIRAAKQRVVLMEDKDKVEESDSLCACEMVREGEGVLKMLSNISVSYLGSYLFAERKMSVTAAG